MEQGDERLVHNKVDLVGLRAQATTVGFLQLCAELTTAGCLPEGAIARIKDVVARDLALSRPNSMPMEEFDGWVRRRLDELFSAREDTNACSATTRQHL